jgi:hypothetical protein
MRRLLRAVAWLFVVTTGLWVIGRAVARRIEGSVDERDAVFRLAAVWGGRQFTSTADPLLSGSAQAVFGGIDLDLTGSVPSPEGARLSLKAVLGGINVTVPATWRVEVSGSLDAGEVHTDVTPFDDLADGAPILLVDVSGRAAGIAIRARSGGPEHSPAGPNGG